VFFASCCGKRRVESSPSATAIGTDEADDRRLSTIAAAVDFAKANNLLGVLLDAELLVSPTVIFTNT
jgi:CDK inhibitor PHO81